MNTESAEHSPGLQQPLLGIFSTLSVIVVAMVVISLFSESIFSSWVSFLLMCCVPALIICGLVWGGNYPKTLVNKSPAGKGLLLTLIATATGTLIAAVILFVVADKAVPPGPQHNIFIISFIVAMFWVVAVLQCEPLASLFKHPLSLGAAILTLCFLLAYAVFHFVMNFEFLSQAPFYQAHMDGQGPFMAFDVLTTMVSSVAMIMAFIMLDFWPVSLMPGAQNKAGQILWSVVWIVALAIGLRYIFVGILQMDQVVYMAAVPIPFIFGAFIMLNLFEASLFAEIPAPAKGFIYCLVSGLLAAALYPLFQFLGPIVSGEMASGGPGYQLEFWCANAMLAVSFPLIVIYTDFFGRWPLKR
jgi:hypothetical protein